VKSDDQEVRQSNRKTPDRLAQDRASGAIHFDQDSIESPKVAAT
jgi:hypothetical protein